MSGIDGVGPWDHDADRWLVEQARGGRVDAFELLVRHHRDRIFRIALRMVGDREDAEDLTQDVVIQLWSGLAGFSGRSTFSTWLYRVVVNRCLNHERRRAPAGRPVRETDAVTTAGPERRALAAAEVRAAMDALANLPPQQRTVLVLHQLEGLSYQQVAAILGVSEAAVRSRLERARRTTLKQLREWS